MALSAAQISAITAKLSINLASQTDNQLIELCLLYRSSPDIYSDFPSSLIIEIEKRFTAAEIANNYVMFAVLRDLSNKINPDSRYKEKLYEFVRATNRETWFAQNISFFEDTLTIPERVSWLVSDNSVLSAVFSVSDAFSKITENTVAMTAIAANRTIMSTIATNSVALAVIVRSAAARNALMINNTIFQENKQLIFNTISTSWTKPVSVSTAYGQNATANTAIANPIGFVFSRMTTKVAYDAAYTYILNHPNGDLAFRADRANFNYIPEPTNLNVLEVISFNGAVFAGTNTGNVGYTELWKPPV